MSACSGSVSEPLKPSFRENSLESERVKRTLSLLNLQSHPEGGYFAETDRDPFKIPNPFLHPSRATGERDDDNSKRAASTSIYYYLTPSNSKGNLHRNSARTVHTLHRGRGRYVLIHADEASPKQKARIETFIVGQNIDKGERLQWIVDGGKYKASYLLPDEEGGSTSDGLLISETVVPGFDYRDHNFLEEKEFRHLVTAEQAEELSWLLRT